MKKKLKKKQEVLKGLRFFGSAVASETDSGRGTRYILPTYVSCAYVIQPRFPFHDYAVVICVTRGVSTRIARGNYTVCYLRKRMFCYQSIVNSV